MCKNMVNNLVGPSICQRPNLPLNTESTMKPLIQVALR